MLTFHGNSIRNCDSVPRRDFLKVGALTLGGLTLADLLRYESQVKANDKPSKKKAVILVYLAGGPSHIDMYDLKPDAPAEIRGEFKPIKTNVAGIDIGEHLPMQANVMHQMSIVRSAYHTNAGHGMGSQWMLTGWQPTIEVNDNIFPSTGSIVAKMKGPNQPGLPAYVTLPNKTPFSKAAYLGAENNPFTPDSDPNQDGFQVRNLKLPSRVTPERLDRRCNLLGQLDQVRRDIDTKGDIVGIDKFYRDAMEMVTSDTAQKAFNLKDEDPKLREKYGRHDLGQSCLLARRLVEAGVTFVTVQTGGGWDTHGDNFNQLKNNLLPKYDRAVTTLIQDIHDRGLDKDVLVISYGEFGRTPRINPGAGRDHWPGAMSVVFSGGGLQMGQVIGATNDKAEYPTEKPYTPGSVLATMYHALGIDHKHVFFDQAQRPMAILAEGKPIAELV
jgi:hypothetical protein